MSWLSESALAAGKQQLKPTSTLVTREDGMRYVDCRPNNYPPMADDSPANLTLNLTTTHGYVVDNKPDLQIGFITDHIFLGSVDTALDKDLLTKLQVTHILTTATMQNYKPPIEVRHLNLDILDLPETDLSKYYTQAFAFIDEAVNQGGRVLVHCNAGVSRSAAITIAYLMKSRHISCDEAWDLVRDKRPAIDPNIGFILQLKKYEEKLMKKTEK